MLSAIASSMLLGPSLLADGFETGISDHWQDRRGKIQIVRDEPKEGKQCLRIDAGIGKGAGGHLVYWFMPGENQVAIRWSVKFASDFDQGNLMHLCAVGGNRTDNKWSSMGKAGLKPSGSDFFVTNLEPWRDWKRNPAPGRLMLYSYWPDMKQDKDGHYWGNNLLSEPSLMVPLGKWVEMSLWIRLNTPGKADGEQSFWMDGKLGGQFKNMRFRDSEILKLNSLSLDLYIHDNVKPNTVWFDDVEIAREPFSWMKSKVERG